jgi:putative oxidoreductase
MSSSSSLPTRSTAADLGMFLLRLAVGTTFIMHGSQKLFTNTAAMTAGFEKMGFPAPGIMVLLAGIAEFVGGILLIFGLGARFAAAAQAVVMAVAIVMAHGFSSWKAIEFPVVLLAAVLLVMLGGAGGWSVDAWLLRRKPTTASVLSAKM